MRTEETAITASTTSPHPEQGQMVSVRSRNWIVIEVSASALTPKGLQNGLESPQHLVTLSSVEDDALSEELNVIWELEPGARVVEKVALPKPTGFDSPERLDAFLDAVCWGAASTADLKNIQSPFRPGIDIEDYQLDPVVRAIQMPRVSLLIADDDPLGLEDRGQPFEDGGLPVGQEVGLEAVLAAEFGRAGLAAQELQNDLGLELSRKGPTDPRHDDDSWHGPVKSKLLVQRQGRSSPLFK